MTEQVQAATYFEYLRAIKEWTGSTQFTKEDVEEARERIVGILHQIHDKCELVFTNNGCDVYGIVG